MKFLAISGSLRAQSTNRSLLLALQQHAPADLEFEIYPDLSALPFFNPDHDTETPPESVRQFRHALKLAQVIVISTPEYAHGIPGVLKNALDWLVRDPDFAGKRIGLIYGSATEGSHAHQSLMEILKTMSAIVPDNGILSVPSVRTKIDSSGQVRDSKLRQDLQSMLQNLIKAAV